MTDSRKTATTNSTVVLRVTIAMRLAPVRLRRMYSRANVCIYNADKCDSNGGTKIRVDNVHYDLTEDDLRVKSLAQVVLTR